MTKINQEEYELLKSFDDKWKWIARDRGGVLWIYEDRPEIFKGTQTWDDLKDSCVYLENDLFHFIQWEDEEPYSIAELIEEYEEAQMTYFDNKLVKELDNFIEESKEAEARKGIEWLKEEVWKQDIIMDKGYIYTDDLMSIINEVDGPEVKQLERKIKELDSFNDELIRDNNQFRNELDNQEVLSEEWIERNTSPVDDEGRLYVWKRDLQNAIVSKPELPVVPTWFDEWWKYATKGGGNLFHNIERFYDELFSSGTREAYDYISSPDNKKNLLNIIVNELEYEVEEEQKYYLKIGNLYLAEPLGDMTSDIVRMTRDKGVAYQFADKKSIATHLDKFEGTEAVKAEEL